MKKYLSYILCIVIPIVLGLFFKLCLVGYGVLAYALFAVGLVSLLFMLLKIFEPKKPKLCKTLNKLACYAILIFLFALAVTISMLASEAKTENNGGADYAIVLGAGVNGNVPSRSLKARIDAALEYAGENPDTVFIVSGGQGRGESVSEAQCMFDYLTANGVSEERIIKEENASDTAENISFSKDIIYERDPDFDGKVCVITEVYHVTRAKLYAEDAGFPVVSAQAGYTGLPILTANYYLREAFAIWYYMLFVR